MLADQHAAHNVLIPVLRCPILDAVSRGAAGDAHDRCQKAVLNWLRTGDNFDFAGLPREEYPIRPDPAVLEPRRCSQPGAGINELRRSERGGPGIRHDVPSVPVCSGTPVVVLIDWIRAVIKGVIQT
jgi:hypothetical protein